MKTFFKLFSLALVFFYSCNNVDLENISGIDFIPSDINTNSWCDVQCICIVSFFTIRIFDKKQKKLIYI